MSQDLQIIGFTLPPGWDPVTWQRLLNAISSGMVARLPGTFRGINDGNGTPLPEDRDKPWNYRDGTTGVGRLYNWSNVYSLWISEFLPGFSTYKRILYVGTEAQLQTEDGGVNEPVDDVHGPFWEVDHEFEFRIPMGPGTSPAGTVLSVAQNLGDEKKTLGVAELAEALGSIPVKYRTDLQDGGGSSAFTNDASNKGTSVNLVPENTGGAQPWSMLNPVRGAFIIKRTPRLYLWRSG